MDINIDGLKIRYTKQGEGKNKILLLHGWGCNIDTFAGIISYLASFMEVYVIDFPRLWRKR